MRSRPNRRLARSLVASVGLATLVLVASAGAAEPDELRVIAATRTDGQIQIVVSVPAVLANRTLDPEAFTVDVDGEPQSVSATRRGPEQIDLAVVATAGSTEEPSATDATRAALVELLVGLPSGARVAVIGGEPPQVLAPLSTDVAMLSSALAAPPASPASTEQAMRLAADTVSGARRPAVLIVGPGADAGTAPSWWPTGVARYVTRVDQDGTPPSTSADATGGVNTTTNPEGAVGALDAVLADLVGQYELTVASPPNDGQTLRVRVTAPEFTADAVVPFPAIANAPTPTAPPAAPESSPVTQATVPATRPSLDNGPSSAVLVRAFALIVALVALVVILVKRRTARRPDEPLVLDTADDRTAPVSRPVAGGAASASTSPTIVLTTPASADGPRPLPNGPFEMVYSPVDALREAVRLGASTILVEPGTGDPSVLVHAVDNHNRAGGRTTRVVTITDTGVVIDLTAAS